MKKELSLSDLKQVYFLGIGGIGMSAIARWFLHNGFPVAGYDKTESPLTKKLAEEGMEIHYEDSIDLIPKICISEPEKCLFIFTPAIPATHQEKLFLIKLKDSFDIVDKSKNIFILFCYCTLLNLGCIYW